MAMVIHLAPRELACLAAQSCKCMQIPAHRSINPAFTRDTVTVNNKKLQTEATSCEKQCCTVLLVLAKRKTKQYRINHEGHPVTFNLIEVPRI